MIVKKYINVLCSNLKLLNQFECNVYSKVFSKDGVGVVNVYVSNTLRQAIIINIKILTIPINETTIINTCYDIEHFIHNINVL